LAGGVALLVTALIASPAQAADVDLRLSGMPSSMSAGGSGAQLVAAIRNTSRETILGIQLTYVLRLEGVRADQVHLGNVQLSGDSGELQGSEVIPALLASRRTVDINRELRFLTGAPSGRARLTLDVALRQDGQWRRADSATANTTVRGKATATATPTAAVDPVLTPGDVVPTETVAAAPPGNRLTANSGSIHWPLYLIGFLLLVGGGGAAAMLLLRRQPDTDPAAGYPGAGPYPDAGPYPAAGPGVGPAAGPYPPRPAGIGPGVDPWAAGSPPPMHYPFSDGQTANLPAVTESGEHGRHRG
ncbi:MAG TPA: hypothetical protein VFE14_19080, partial [Micromonosporaceae bacterium]|nr:hypothetical protein [Micromonosporaceae bacterium]